MNFEKVAYLFDTTILNGGRDSSVYGALSLVGAPLYISTYASEEARKFDNIPFHEDNFAEWLKTPKNSEDIITFMIRLYENIDNLGISSFLIEKEFSVFIYLISLMSNSNMADNPKFRTYLDDIYSAYKLEYPDRIKLDSVDETIVVFNQRIQHILQTQKGHEFFKNMLKENGRALNEQLSVHGLVRLGGKEDFMIADHFLYSQQILKDYQNNGVLNIYATQNAGKRFSEAIDVLDKSPKVDISVNEYNEQRSVISDFAGIMMMSTNHIMEKVLNAKSVDALTEEDKYLLVIVWMIFQNGGSNMFINGKSYNLIKDVFVLLKKEMDI